MRMAKSGRDVVMPGDELGVIEEYMPGSGTYEDDGKIKSYSVGALDLDAKNRKVGVKVSRRIAVPEVGDLVEAIVTLTKDDKAVVKIVAIRGKRGLSGDFTGELHISQAAKSYTKSMHDITNVNDRILAKVITGWTPYQLSTADDNLGVIFATCTKCGDNLVLRGDKLVCLTEKVYERRKVSSEYSLRE